ncbi:hypothetical protein AB9K34_19190 [Sedimentitalea sp. XS_ASV28]|uniref:hypothetical protein n=1 Tax=Sedimentitalea sp. XS_ASV28 TaxID=3241296 RepID=UPI003514CE3E
MQVIIHTGAHCTDGDRILKCLLRNKQAFADRGIAVPGPGRYRELLGHSFRAMSATAPAPDAREVLMDAILDEEHADRMILSNAYFFGSRRLAVRDGQLYPAAPERVRYLHKLFRGDRLTMFMGLRNPASFLPAVLGNPTREQLADVLGGTDPGKLRWSDCLRRIHAAAPDMDMIVWCNEDTPLLWAHIIRQMAGLQPDEKIVGGFDLLSDLITREGMQKFRAYLHTHTGLNENQKRCVIAAFLENFAIPERMEEELDLPGWTEELVEELSDAYDDDLTRIRQIPGVTLIDP